MSQRSQLYPLNDSINTFEHFSSITPIVEQGAFMSVDVSEATSSSTQNSESTSITNTNTTNETTNTNVTDNSMISNSTVQTDTNIDSSQKISNVSSVDNSSVQNISSSTNTYNVDSSQTVNQAISSTENELIQSCGMTIQDAQAAVNIVKDESINTNIDASNTFIVTGNNNTISDVQLESQIDFVGGGYDRSCVLDAANDLANTIDAINENQKEMAGGVGGSTGAESGGNVTSTENTSEKADAVDGGVDAVRCLW